MVLVVVKCLLPTQETEETRVRFLGQEDPLEGMAAHSSILAWRIPWTEEPGGLQSTGAHGQTQLKQLSMHAHKIVVNRFILLIKLWYKKMRLKKGKVGLWGTRCWKSISTFYSVPWEDHLTLLVLHHLLWTFPQHLQIINLTSVIYFDALKKSFHTLMKDGKKEGREMKSGRKWD